MGKITKIKWNNSDHAQWEAQRKEMEGIGHDHVRIGASDVSVIMGTNKWKEKQRLFRHLTGEYSNFQLTETTVAGHLQEPITVARWESWDADQQLSLMNTLRGIKVRHLKKADFFILNSDYPHFFISLDYIPDGEQYSPFTGELYEPLTPHELKHTNWGYYKEWKNGMVPQYYDQIQTQMLLTNTQLAVFHVLVDGVKYNVQEVPRDEKRIAEIIAEVNKFCQLVIDGKQAYYGAIHGETEEIRERFLAVYESMLPEFIGSDDAVNLANELWEQPSTIDKEANFKKATKKEDTLMNDYYGMLRLEEQVKKNKQRIQGTLKLASSKWGGIKSDNYKMINRALPKPYFSIKPIKQEEEAF